MKKTTLFILLFIFIGISKIHAQSGELDTSFDPGIGANAAINAVAIQSDGKIIIGGDFTNYNGVAINRIARLNSDGSLDTSFNVGAGFDFVFSGVQAITIDATGKIIVSGGFTKYNTISKKHIVRLNIDGSIDSTFLMGTGADNPILAIAIQLDGKIVIGGGFTKFNGTNNVNRILRLNNDGTIDTSFNAGIGLDNYIKTISIESDGKIIIGGEFTTYNGVSSNKIAKINSNGTLDTSFNIGTGASNTVWSTKTQSNGKIIVGGLFTIFNGTSKNYITRLNADGSIDPTFDIGVGASNVVKSVALQFNNKIIFSGDYQTYNSISTNRMARLLPNGLKDTDFDNGSAADNSVNSVAIQADGNIIMVGNFLNYQNISRGRIARVFGDAVLSSSVFNKNAVRIHPNPSSNTLYFSTDNNLKIDGAKIFDTTGKLIFSAVNLVDNTIDISNLSNGIYFISLQDDEKGIYTQKFIKN